MDDITLGLIGLAGLYTMIHMVVIGFNKCPEDRSTYEKTIFIAWVVFLGLLIIWIMWD